MTLKVFFTPWGKCRDTSIIRNCDVTDSFYNFSSFTHCTGAWECRRVEVLNKNTTNDVISINNKDNNNNCNKHLYLPRDLHTLRMFSLMIFCVQYALRNSLCNIV